LIVNNSRIYNGHYTQSAIGLIVPHWVVGFLVLAWGATAHANAERFERLTMDGRHWNGAGGASSWSCVLDSNTGLLWEVHTQDGGMRDARHTYTWHAANSPVAHCALPECTASKYVESVNRIRLCGASDWRLPTREELRSLVDYTRVYPVPTIDTALFPYTRAQFYWSSSEDASDARSAWGIGFAYGFDYAYPKEHAVHVRLVRSGDTPTRDPAWCDSNRTATTADARFELGADGTAYDRRTRLLWRRCSLGQTWNGSDCVGEARRVGFVAASRAAAPQSEKATTWRLPKLAELAGLVELACGKPAINRNVFPATAHADYWTATSLAGDLSRGWFVNFMYGDSHAASRDDTAHVRFVSDSDTSAAARRP
jgi:hypothetical protein